MMDIPTTAGIGDNRGPSLSDSPFDRLVARKDDLFAGINRFVTENPAIDSQEMIDKVADFKSQISALAKDIDKQRKAEKQPHLDAGRAIDTKYSPLEQIVARGLEKIVGRLTEAMKAMNKKREDERLAALAEQKRLQDEADKAKREAEKMAMKAEDGALPDGADFMGAEQKAFELQAAADAQQEQVRDLRGNVKGGTGEVDGKKKTVALHTYHSAKITDAKACLNYFFAMKETRPALIEVIEKLANAAVKKCMAANDPDSVPPGVEVVTDQRAQ